MYHNETDLSPTSPDNHHIESLTGGDPFYDRFPWFRLVGRLAVHLTGIIIMYMYMLLIIICFILLVYNTKFKYQTYCMLLFGTL